MSATQPRTPEDWLARTGVRAVTDGAVTRACLSRSTPLTVFLTVVIIVAVLGAFVIPLASAILNPRPVPTLGFVAYAMLTLGTAGWLAARRARRMATGLDDLVIDEAARVLTIPATFDRKAPYSIPFADIVSIELADEKPASATPGFDDQMFGPRRYVRRPADPDEIVPEMGYRSQRWHAAIVFTTRGAEPITAWTSEPRVRGLIFWLRDRLGLELRPAPTDGT
ncbi:MAG: hypothetical protein ACYTGR_08620 [Planctomycetota bacterium]|jgi:hypothetical protein